jgi:hypothetical protein
MRERRSGGERRAGADRDVGWPGKPRYERASADHTLWPEGRSGSDRRQGSGEAAGGEDRASQSRAGRVESGPVRIGDDWAGVFIRGDNACGWMLDLSSLVVWIDTQIAVPMGTQIAAINARNLAETLGSCREPCEAVALRRADAPPTTAQPTPAAPSTLDVGGERDAIAYELNATFHADDPMMLDDCREVADRILAICARARPPGSAPGGRCLVCGNQRPSPLSCPTCAPGGESEPLGWVVVAHRSGFDPYCPSPMRIDRERAEADRRSLAESDRLGIRYTVHPVGRAPAEQQEESNG